MGSGAIITSECSGLTYAAAPAEGAIWVPDADLNIKQVLTQADDIGKAPGALAAHPSLGRLYMADQSASLVRAISEECKAATLNCYPGYNRM